MEVASRSEHKADNQEHSFYWPAGGDSSSVNACATPLIVTSVTIS